MQSNTRKQAPTTCSPASPSPTAAPRSAELWLLPTLWFRNTWIWGCRHEGCTEKPSIRKAAPGRVELRHESLGGFHAAFGDHPDGAERELLFTGNETNSELLFKTPSHTPYVKDAFHRYVIDGETDAVNPDAEGTKVAACYHLTVPAGESREVTFRLAEVLVERGFVGERRERVPAASGRGRRVLPCGDRSRHRRPATSRVATSLRGTALDASSSITTSSRTGSMEIATWPSHPPATPRVATIAGNTCTPAT